MLEFQALKPSPILQHEYAAQAHLTGITNDMELRQVSITTATDTKPSHRVFTDEEYRNSAVTFIGTMSMVERNRQISAADAQKFFSKAKTIAQQSSSCCDALIAVQKYCMTADSFDVLLEYIDSAERSVPVTIVSHLNEPTSEHDALTDLIREAAREGKLHDFFSPQPKVERWISDTTNELMNRILKSRTAQDGVVNDLANLVIGVSANLHNIAGGVSEYYRVSKRSSDVEHSLVGRAIFEIREALTTNLISRLLEHCKNQPDFEKQMNSLSTFAAQSLRDRIVPPHSSLEGAREAHRRIINSQPLIENAIYKFKCLSESDSLIAALECGSPHASPSSELRSLKAPRTLPFGEVIIIKTEPSSTAEQAGRYFYSNGPCHRTEIGTLQDPHPNSYPGMVCLNRDYEGIDIERSRSLVLDDTGKLIFSMSDWLAPPLNTPEYRAINDAALRVENEFLLKLEQLWETYPRAFAQLEEHGPFIFVEHLDDTFLLIPNSACDSLGEILGCAPISSRAAELFEKPLGIPQLETWSALKLARPTRTEPAPDLDSETSAVPKQITIRDYKSEVRELLNQYGALRYQNLLHVLKPLGVVESSKGRGSHGSLTLASEAGTHRQNTWSYMRRENEPLQPVILHEVIEQLKLDYGDFIASLRQYFGANES